MKILLITHLVPYPPSGGNSLRNYNLLKETSFNHDIHMITFNQKAHLGKMSSLENSKKAIAKLCKHLEVFEIPSDKGRLSWYWLLLANLFSLKPYSVKRFYSKEMAEAVRKQIAEHDFDVMEIGTIALGEFAKLAPDIPKVLVHHNIESQLLYRRSRHEGNFLSRLYVRYQAWKLRRYEKQLSEIIGWHTSVSEGDKQTFLQFCPDARMTVVPNGVDTEFFKATTDPIKPNRVIYVGGLNWFPNYDAMEFFYKDIYPLVKEVVPDIEVVHIGHNPRDEFSRTAEKKANFKFMGFVDDIRPEITRSPVFIVPLRIGGGTRLKILDAMSMGKAIVSTSIGCEGIDVTDGKNILIADTPRAFADRIIEILQNDERRREIERHARQLAENVYSWKKIAPVLEDVYTKLASENSSRKAASS